MGERALAQVTSFRDAVPFSDVPQLRIPVGHADAAERVRVSGNTTTVNQRDDRVGLHDHVVHRHRQPAALLEVRGAGHFGHERIVLGVTVALDVGALPLGIRARNVRAQPVGHVGLRVHAREVVGVHLDVRVELLERVRGCRIAAEEYGRVDVAQLGVDANLGPPLLHQSLRVLTDGVGGGLVEHGERHTIQLADAVAVGVDDAGFIKQGVGAVDVLHEAAIVGRRGIGLRRGQDVTGRLAACAIAYFNQQRAVDGHGHGLTHDRVGQERVGSTLHGGAHVAQCRIRVGLVQVQALDRGAEGRYDRTVTLSFHLCQDRRVDLQVPRVVELAGFKHGTRCGRRIATTFEGYGREMRLLWHAVVIVRRQLDHVIRAEIGDHEGAGADGAEVGLGALGRAGAEAVGELSRLDDRALGADQRSVGERRRFSEGNLDGRVIHGHDAFDTVEVGCLRAAAFRMGAIFPGEDRVACRQRGAVGPGDAFLQRPCDLGQIFGDAAVFNRRDFRSEPRHHLAGVVKAR
mmetsp:Transcript_1016/g.1996  ORF Transcript_1016/g.1996 Transcript_1016/m.1996 type:complete len:518 (-) Transcript_1016:288-1841(-)